MLEQKGPLETVLSVATYQRVFFLGIWDYLLLHRSSIGNSKRPSRKEYNKGVEMQFFRWED